MESGSIKVIMMQVKYYMMNQELDGLLLMEELLI